MLKHKASITSPQALKPLILLLLALLVAGAAAGVTLSLTQAQTANGVYDTDGDKLIEISYLEQLAAIGYDPDGDGDADNPNSAIAYAGMFPVEQGKNVCDSGCNGYELSNSLNFKQAASYRSGTVNIKWSDSDPNGWTPIAYIDSAGAASGYSAKFNGNGYTISNLYTSGESTNRASGLFAELDDYADVENLTLASVNIEGGYGDGGALAGRNSGKISNVTASGEVVGKGDLGGLIGNNETGGTITESSTSGNVTGEQDNVGGIAGDNWGTIGLSSSSAKVSGNMGYIGGIAGYSAGTIDRSYATGNVESTSTGGASGGGNAVGGLLGKNLGTVTASYATGSAKGIRDIGGLAGVNVGSIKGSYATGAVKASSINAGGLVGHNKYNASNIPVIESSYATGNVSDSTRLGGLVGSNGASVKYSYAIGKPSGRSQLGGLVGLHVPASSTQGSVTDSYWNTETSGIATDPDEEDTYGAGKTTLQLAEPTSASGIYANWGAGNRWDFGTGTQYPALKADLNNDGTATAAEFGSQRTGVHAPSITPTPTPTPAVPAPTPDPTPQATPEATEQAVTDPTPTPEAVTEPTPTPTPTPAPTPTPTPGGVTGQSLSETPEVVASDPSATTMKLSLARKQDSWYYKYTSPAGGTCSAEVTQNVHRITGLSMGTSYSFSAYTSSTCTDGKIGEAAATSTLSPALSYSSVTANTATMTLSGWNAGHDGNWHFKADKAPYASCSSAVSGADVSLQNLDSETEYNFKAYRASGCADSSEIAEKKLTTTNTAPTPTPTRDVNRGGR